MPRLPDRDDIGYSIPGSRSIVQGPRTTLGRSLRNVGETFEREATAAREERDALDLSRARADWATRRVNERSLYDYAKDQDYATWKTRFDQNIIKHRDASAALINSPKLRARFEDEAKVDIAGDGLDIDGRARGIDQDRRVQEGIAAIDQQMNAAAALPRGPEADRAIDRARASIDNMTFAGLLTPAQAIERRQRTVEQYAAIRASRDSEDDPNLSQAWLSGADMSGPSGLIRNFENFRATPYWDVDAYRIGYGSDTITTENGDKIPVTLGMRITRKDAERDLARRIGEFQDSILKDIGVDAWSKLPGNAQAALTSIAYNYGSLPKGVAQAAKTGDLELLAAAVEDRAGDNQGINAGRRGQEAAVIRGAAGNRYAAMARPDYYEFLTPQARAQLTSQTEAEIARRDKERDDISDLERYAVSQEIEDDISQIEETGVATGIDHNRVVSALGADRAAKWLDRRKRAAETFAAVTVMDGMSDNAIETHLQGLEPKVGAENFDRRQDVFEKAEKRAAKLRDLRLKDPALAVDESAVVKKARETYDPANPVSVQALVRARLAAQEMVDIPRALRQPVTRREAYAIIAPVQKTFDMWDAALVAAAVKAGGSSTARRLAAKQAQAGSEEQIRDVIEDIDKRYGPYSQEVLAFAIAESVRDKEIGGLAARAMRKIANRETLTKADLQALDAANDTSLAAKAVSGELPAPKAISAPPAAGQPPAFKTPGRGPQPQARFPRPDDKAINALINDPTLAPAFDRSYGPGASQEWLPRKESSLIAGGIRG